MHSAKSVRPAVAAVFPLVLVGAIAACSSSDDKPSSSSSGGSTSSSSTSSSSSGGTDGGTDTGTDTGVTTKKKNAEVGCTKNEDCESNICFTGGNQSFCTVQCTAENAATVCVAPFTGSCNNKGYCKRD